MTKHRQFTEEFKRDAVKRAAEQGVNKSALAKSLEISGNILHRWIREEKAVASGVPRAPRGRPRREGTQTQLSSTAASSQKRSARSPRNIQAELEAINVERTQLKEALRPFLTAGA